MSPTPTTNTSPDAAQPWYTDAIFYEVSVQSYFDATGDGIGDFRGLTQKLDYIQELGATCIWLLPFLASPLKDDGYDISDYRAIHPAYGGIDDFKVFLQEAHRRGLRVAAEIAINHTSDQHPWFLAARQAAANSSLRNYYHWSPTSDRFPEAEVLFRDAAHSNWSWDTAAKAFYWHRFFAHEPDLNYGHADVQREMLKVLRFWADQGVDGLCLNGAAYLAEQEATRCEHLPESHAILRQLRQELASAYPHLMLEAGVNAWPAQAHEYFGGGQQCHLAPHMALAQRLFLALRQETSHPLVNLLEQTPVPPPGCQWVTLLRNHDELTLTLASDEERDYLFHEYAADPSMRLHNGILRRLAPLLDNDQQRLELVFGLLFALPGAPLIYYGDEIGMGDNVFLSGRQGVRTPMQWSPDRNAGFSQADFARLYSPPVMDTVYGFPSVNVEAQLRDTSSQFHWLRRLIALRKNSRALSQGSLRTLSPGNARIVAFIRHLPGDDGETVLVVANLARTAQPAALDLAEFQGRIPVEMFGRVPFQAISAAPYTLTLGPHGIYLFRLQTSVQEVALRRAPVATEHVSVVPEIELHGVQNLLEGETRETLERAVLPGFLKSQRWFGGKARQVQEIRLRDWGEFPGPGDRAYLLLIEVSFAHGARDLYFLPLGIAAGAEARRIYDAHRPQVLAHLKFPDREALLFDALASDRLCHALLEAIGASAAVSMQRGTVTFSPTAAYARSRGNTTDRLPARLGPATSSNSLVFYGRRLLLKLFRRLAVGVNPDFEIGRFLTEDAQFHRIPMVAGSLEYVPSDGEGSFMLGILQQLVSNQGDGWHHAIDELGRYYERASGRMFGPDPVSPDPRPLPELAQATPPLAVLETLGTYLHPAATLGRRTAEMHLALAADRGQPDFTPRWINADDVDEWRGEVLHQAEQAFGALHDSRGRLPEELAEPVAQLLKSGLDAVERFAESLPEVITATKTRIHGDYHLGQVLWVDNDYIILDFEGEPMRSVEERRQKFSPVRDVAGMLRSYHYAAYAGLFAFTLDRQQDFERLVPWAELWQQWVSAAFLRSYLQTAGDAAFLPRDPQQFSALLDCLMLSKAFYELSYELNNRPTWVRIPLSGVLSLLSGPPVPASV